MNQLESLVICPVRSAVGTLAICLLSTLLASCAEPPELEVEESRISIAHDARVLEQTLVDIDLGSPGSRAALRQGWSYNERGEGRSFVWAVGPESTLEIELEEVSDLVLDLVAKPFQDLEHQVVTIEVNGEAVASYSLRQGWMNFHDRILIPASLVQAGANEIVFRYSRFRDAKDRSGRPLRRYAAAWDRIRLYRPSRVERDGEKLFLPTGETLSITWRSAEPSFLRIDEVIADKGAEGLEIRLQASDQGQEPVLLATLGEGLDQEVVVAGGEERVELLMTARGASRSGFHLVSPHIEGKLERRALPNVLLISIDTLRADHLGVYGYERETAPSLKALAKDSVLFEEAISQGPSTLISHASLFSSMLPQHHRASYHYRRGLPDEVVTLTEVLRDAGFRCGSINGGGQLDPVFGLDQGFELYDRLGDRFYDVVQAGSSWIDQDRSQPFFLFLHSYEVHHPYRPRPEDMEIYDGDYTGSLPATISKEFLEMVNRGEVEIDEADRRHIVNSYDSLIRSMDRGLERLIDYLRINGLYDSTLIVFTSDHGEEFGEHGRMGWHSHSLFDELLRVPLIIKPPRFDGEGRVVSDPVRSIDVAPTILEILGLEIPEGYDGQSLVPAIEGSSLPALPAIAMIDQEKDGSWSIRMGGEKWYRGMLFDLVRDPGEKHDLAKSNPERARELRKLLEELVASREPLVAREIEVSDETQERLRALGYL